MSIPSTHTLFIRIGKDKFVFATYDRIKDSTLNYSVFPINPNISVNANMHNALKRVTLTKGDWGLVNVSIESSILILPLSEFNEDNQDQVYFYNYPDKAADRKLVFFDILPTLNSVLLSSIDKDLHHTILEAFPQAAFHASQMPMVLHFASLSRTTSSISKIFVCYAGNSLHLASFCNSKLSYWNSYETNGMEDAIFYLLSFAKSCGYSASDELYIVEQEKKSNELFQSALEYFSNVQMLNLGEEFNRQAVMISKDIPYDMINLLYRSY